MEDDQQFCLRWNNHQSTLIQNFDTLLESGTLVDCTLATEGKYLKAHKVVLSACSPFFEVLLSEHYDKHPVFILKDVKFKELKAMMDYMYRGEVNISQDQLAGLLKAAESLQIKGLSESKTSGSNKTDSRQQKVVPQATAQPTDIPHASSGLTIEKNKVPRQGMAQQGSIGDLAEDSGSPQIPKGLSSREGSQSPTSRKRKRFRRRSIGDDNSVENHEASNSSDMPQQMGVPALGIAPVADEKAHADSTDTIGGRSALMTQLTKPADEMLQLPLEKPEPNDNLIEPKSEYLEDPEESVEDLTLDDDMNDLNEMEQDNNRAGPSHDPSQHPAGIGAWHVTGDRSNAGGVVGSVAGAPGTTDEVFLAAQEAAQAHRDSQDLSFPSQVLTDERNAFVSLAMQHIRNANFSCPNCTSVFNRKDNLQKHLKYECDLEHLGGFKIPCNAMPRPTEFQDRNKGRFPCPKCTSTFNRKNNLYSHLKFECGQLPRFGCPYCDYASKKSSNIRAHVRRKHNGYKVSVINVSRNPFAESATTEDESSEKLVEQTF
ncbi:PREDICTED: longitudinals lacking protein, isoforms A/B/D/L isoform X3 [Eufriesea mexicana]|uniref:longitudinals lacking protein, isoforms A/B/D/L isoform X3 n=1 Tax=Eufriesea mexicana TaxID=516756 RepID=UPI00083C07A3|nr:PREDICTED: longitudinals lacking protein, isoforms A/B/D/L isoform X3 [Eufriesea mexicana]